MIPMRDYISQSSECMMAIPVADFTSGGALAYTSHFFEFIKESEVDVEFLYRLGKTSSITGEKLTEQHVLDAAAAASAELAITPYEYLCYPVSGQDPHYAVMLEWDEEADDPSAVRWCEVFNHGLIGANSEYADKFASGRLGKALAMNRSKTRC